jgi:hypothetical protein
VAAATLEDFYRQVLASPPTTVPPG